MQNYKILSLDESGKASYNHPSKLFIVSGVVVSEKYKKRLNHLIKKLKKRYFNDEEIIFHGRDISRKKGPFVILRDAEIEKNFWGDFISIINNTWMALSFVIVDKQKAKSKNWQRKTILERSYFKIIELFVLKQLKGNKGKIILESEPSQDRCLIKAHNQLQGMGTTDGSISPQEYRQKITCLSLVNKGNLDVDVQIADALAPIAGMIYKKEKLKEYIKTDKIEESKKRLIKRKIASKLNTSVFEILIK